MAASLSRSQTSANGKASIASEVERCLRHRAGTFYLGFVLDRKSERIMIVASAHGGMEIEDLARKTPNSLRRMTLIRRRACPIPRRLGTRLQLSLKGHSRSPRW
ncbi:MAG: ATP-grasp domain-containing protein [Paracoccaceae bacterium]